jgi:hypothetical protein
MNIQYRTFLERAIFGWSLVLENRLRALARQDGPLGLAELGSRMGRHEWRGSIR